MDHIGIITNLFESHKIPTTTDEAISNPQDPAKDRFTKLEAQVASINCNVNLLMAALNNKPEILIKDGGSNA